VYVVLTQGLNLVFGYLGLLSLGQQAFIATGGYVAAMLALKLGLSFWITFPAAIIGTIILGFIVGYITLRLRGAYFVIVTVAVAGVIQLLPLNLDFLGGPPGLRGIPRPAINLGELFSYQFTGKVPYYYLIWIIAGLSIVAASRLINSRQGRAFKAIREHENLAEAVGISPFRHAMLAFIVSVAMAGAAGAFLGHYLTLVSPEMGAFAWTLSMLVMVAVGGQGTIWGPVLGSVIFVVLPEFLRIAEGFRMPIYGVILMLAVLFFPKGLWPIITDLYESIVERTNPIQSENN
jgi:branched-chain amino acid transport system permease protein